MRWLTALLKQILCNPNPAGAVVIIPCLLLHRHFFREYKMFSLRVNFKTKVMVMETAEMCGIPVSAVFRTVALWIKNGRLTFANPEKTEVMVKDRSGNVIIYTVDKNYHNQLMDFLTADITMPKECQSQKEFRALLIAACLDTQAKYRPEWERKKDMDKRLKELESSLPSIQRLGMQLGVL
jgi:hypothetical protein